MFIGPILATSSVFCVVKTGSAKPSSPMTSKITPAIRMAFVPGIIQVPVFCRASLVGRETISDSDVNGAQQPQHEQDNEQGAKHSAQTCAAIAVVAIVAAAAEQQQKDYDDQYQAHGSILFGRLANSANRVLTDQCALLQHGLANPAPGNFALPGVSSIGLVKQAVDDLEYSAGSSVN